MLAEAGSPIEKIEGSRLDAVVNVVVVKVLAKTQATLLNGQAESRQDETGD